MLNMTMQNYNKNLNTADNLDDNITTIVNYERNSSVENTKMATSTYFTIRSQAAPGHTGLIYSISGSVITGVYDKHGNPQKDTRDVIGESVVSFIIGEMGPVVGRWLAPKLLGATTGARAGAVGGWIGAGIGLVAGFIFADDINNLTKEAEGYFSNLFDSIVNHLSTPQTGFFTISNPTAYETDGKITFTINLKQPLKEDVKLRLKTMDQTAKADLDFEGIDSYITIPAGETTYEYTVKIASDGIYEGSEKFNLYIADINYNGDDEVILNYSPGYGTILDFPQQECPKPQIPNFGFSFHTPTTKHISGGDNSYSGGGGGWGSSSIAYTPTTPSKKSLPYIPEYECYYDPELNSVLKVKLPSNLNTKNGNQTNNELNFTSSNNSNNTSTLRNFSKNLSTSTINSLNLINSKDLKQTDLNTTQTIKSSNNLDDNNQLSTLNLKESNTPSNNPNPKQTKLYFDMNSDGFKERMLNWLNDDEAILINDINNNGLVDSGLEIIGNNYNNTSSPDSFTLLKKFDTNKDGIIDSKDSHNLALWIDSEKAA